MLSPANNYPYCMFVLQSTGIVSRNTILHILTILYGQYNKYWHKLHNVHQNVYHKYQLRS